MARTPEAKTESVTLATQELVGWQASLEKQRQNLRQLEVKGYRAIKGFVKDKLGNDNQNGYHINNKSVVTTFARTFGIVEMMLSRDWLYKNSKNPTGLFKLSIPQDYENAFYLEFINGKEPKNINEYDSVSITLKYDSGFAPDTNSGRRVKAGSEKTEVSFYYLTGNIQKDRRVYSHSSKNAEQLIEELNQVDTLTKLKFVSELLKEAFSQDHEKLIPNP